MMAVSFNLLHIACALRCALFKILNTRRYHLGVADFYLRFEGMGPELTRVTVPEGSRRVLGRVPHPEIDIVVPHGTVSRRAAVFANTGWQWSIMDMRSVSGTYVNRYRIDPDVPTVISDGDRIRIGGVICHVHVGPPGDPSWIVDVGVVNDLRRSSCTTESVPRAIEVLPGERHTLDGGRVVEASQFTPGDHFIAGNRLYLFCGEPPALRGRTIADLVAAQESKSAQERWMAVRELGIRAPEMPGVRVALDEAQTDPDAAVRKWAEWAQTQAAPGSFYLHLEERRIEIPRGQTRKLHGPPGPCRDVLLPINTVRSVSSVHVQNDGDAWNIRDTLGDYDVTLGDRPIGRESAALAPGDVLHIGGVRCVVSSSSQACVLVQP